MVKSLSQIIDEEARFGEPGSLNVAWADVEDSLDGDSVCGSLPWTTGWSGYPRVERATPLAEKLARARALEEIARDGELRRARAEADKATRAMLRRLGEAERKRRLRAQAAAERDRLRAHENASRSYAERWYCAQCRGRVVQTWEALPSGAAVSGPLVCVDCGWAWSPPQ